MSYELRASSITAKYSDVPRDPGTIGLLVFAGAEALAGTGALAGTASIGGLTAGALITTAGGVTVLTGAQLVGTAILIGASIAVSVLTADKQGRKIEATDNTIKQSLPGRFIDVGKVKTNGCIFFEDRGQVGSALSLVIGTILSCTTIEAIEKIYFEDQQELPNVGQPVPPDQFIKTIVSGSPWTQQVQLEVGRGRPTETAPSILATQFSQLGYSFLGVPNPDFANRGLAYAVVSYQQAPTIEAHHNSFPNGPPPISAVIFGAMLPDPRNVAHDLSNPATWTYSDNSALAVLRYCLDVDGWGLKPDDIDLNSFVAAANRCDVMMADGFPRYCSWGRYWTTTDRASTLRDLLAACDGRLLELPNGKTGLIVGNLTDDDLTRLVTIKTEDILEATFNPFGDTLDRIGAVKPRYISEANNWQETDGAPVQIANPDADQAIKVEDLAIQFCPREGQARRLANARLNILNPDWRGTITTRLVGMQAFGERFVNVLFEPPGGIQINNGTAGVPLAFEIVGGLALNLENGIPVSVTMQIVSVKPSNWEAPA